ncbi:hypothetical protein ACA910_021202 [Epithemia clementina (nom. ined.)]
MMRQRHRSIVGAVLCCLWCYTVVGSARTTTVTTVDEEVNSSSSSSSSSLRKNDRRSLSTTSAVFTCPSSSDEKDSSPYDHPEQRQRAVSSTSSSARRGGNSSQNKHRGADQTRTTNDSTKEARSDNTEEGDEEVLDSGNGKTSKKYIKRHPRDDNRRGKKGQDSKYSSVSSSGKKHVKDETIGQVLLSLSSDNSKSPFTFHILINTLQAAGLWNATLDQANQWTLWAPTDDAFAQLGEGVVQDLVKNQPETALRQILLYHVLPCPVTLHDLTVLDASSITLPTLLMTMMPDNSNNNNNAASRATLHVMLAMNLGTIFVQGAENDVTQLPKVLAVDWRANNGGVVHIVDQVLLPDLTESGDFPFPPSQAPNIRTDKPTTATALPTAMPTALPNAMPNAMPNLMPTALPTALPNAMPTALPIAYMPTAMPTAIPTAMPTAIPTAMPTTTKNQTIVDIAQERGFQLFLQFSRDTGTIFAIDEPDDPPLTVFAPTDDAFVALGSFPLQYISNRPGVLLNIVLYHLVRDVQMSSDLTATAAKSEPVGVTLFGNQTFYITIDSATGTLEAQGNGNMDPSILSRLDPVDLEAANGVIHVADHVILPYLPIAATAALHDLSLFVQAMLDTALEELLNGDEDFDQVYTVFAPINSAFGDVDEEALKFLLENEPEVVAAMLDIHVLVGVALDSTQIAQAVAAGQETFVTKNADRNITVVVNETDGRIYVAGPGNVGNAPAEIVKANVVATNGILHIISGSLLFP